MAYEVQTPVYTGPFDLLLHLILREQVELYEISLVEIVDAYVTELERIESLDLEIATEFLLIAATLTELKARRLLPDTDDGELDEDLALWEERDLLLARLVECKTFKDASAVLERMALAAARTRARHVGLDDRFRDLVPDVLAGVTPEDLRDAFMAATRPRPRPRVELDHVAPIRVSVADALAEVAEEVRQNGRCSFRSLTAGCTERLEVIVRFLAVLELCKQGVVDLDQAGVLGEISVSWAGGAAESVDLALVDAYDG
ncbi:MAG: segregation/condensation protein A [Actinomycetota bacterium]|nr:segregation/condensation protein A [Actinomycetota bacterium]